MRSRSFSHIAWVVIFAVMVLLAVTTGSAVAHELQHAAHHGAGMHGSGICAWMCATDGAHAAGPIHFAHLFAVTGDASVYADTILLPQFLILSRPRAPPVFV